MTLLWHKKYFQSMSRSRPIEIRLQIFHHVPCDRICWMRTACGPVHRLPPFRRVVSVFTYLLHHPEMTLFHIAIPILTCIFMSPPPMLYVRASERPDKNDKEPNDDNRGACCEDAVVVAAVAFMSISNQALADVDGQTRRTHVQR